MVQSKQNQTHSGKIFNQLLKRSRTIGTRQELKKKIGKRTKHHSKHVHWPVYIYEDKVFEYCITETEEKNGQYITNMENNSVFRIN